MFQVPDESLLTNSSLISPIPEQEECRRSLISGREEPSLVPVHPNRFTSPRMKKLLASHKAPKHAAVQVCWVVFKWNHWCGDLYFPKGVSLWHLFKVLCGVFLQINKSSVYTKCYSPKCIARILEVWQTFTAFLVKHLQSQFFKFFKSNIVYIHV